MTVKTETCHFVVCDGCGDTELGSEYCEHFNDAGLAEEHAEECDVFATADGKHYCDHCIENGNAPPDVLEAVKAKHEEWRREQQEFEARWRRAPEATS